MNKKEMNTLCSLLAEWEFRSGGGTSEAVGRAGCMEELRMSFNITEEDLSVYRTIEICKRAGDESDEFFDAVSDIVDDDYKGLLNAIDDANSFQVVRQLVEAKAAKPKL